MGFRNVEFPYNDHKLEALQKALTSRDREYTSELVIALDSLYEKYVPANEKETVSKKIAMDHIKDGILNQLADKLSHTSGKKVYSKLQF